MSNVPRVLTIPQYARDEDGVIGAGLWSASLGLAFNPIDHRLVIRYGSRRTRTLDQASQGSQLEYGLAWGRVTWWLTQPQG